MISSIVNELAKKYFKKRDNEKSKFDFGKCLIIGGSYKYVGAAQFAGQALDALYGCSEAVMRCGVGLSHIALPGKIAEIAMKHIKYSGIIKMPQCCGNMLFSKHIMKSVMKHCNAVAIGMGMNAAKTDKFIKYILDETNAQIVIDADALKHLKVFNLQNRCILTPNQYEFISLIGKESDDNIMAEEYAKDHKCVMLLKSHNTFITDGVHSYINQTGNVKLAKGGSGDILSGIICGLLGIGANIYDAGILGSYILGRCAEISIKNEFSILPEDIVAEIPKVIDELANL